MVSFRSLLSWMTRRGSPDDGDVGAWMLSTAALALAPALPALVLERVFDVPLASSWFVWCLITSGWSSWAILTRSRSPEVRSLARRGALLPIVHDVFTSLDLPGALLSWIAVWWLGKRALVRVEDRGPRPDDYRSVIGWMLVVHPIAMLFYLVAQATLDGSLLSLLFGPVLCWFVMVWLPASISTSFGSRRTS